LGEKTTEELEALDLEFQLGLCIIGGIFQNKEEFDQTFGGKAIQEIDMEKFGEDVGIEMLSICPEIFLKFIDDYDEDDDSGFSGVELGKISGIEKKQFNVVNLESGDGSILKFLWLWDFTGSELLIDGSYKDKWLNVVYSNIELYDAQKATYVVFKVIEAIVEGE
ncbi:MAG: hypothetical protein WA897_04510, partial [Moheibacter sp.]